MDIHDKIKLNSATKGVSQPLQDPTLQVDKRLYESSIGTSSHGEDYQRELGMLLLWRATQAGYDFKLGNEMTVADKYDDIVFQNKAKAEWWLLQAKHSDTTEGVKPKFVDLEELFPKKDQNRKKGNFSLYKYYQSYLNVKDHFQGSRRFFLFTNREFKPDGLKEWVTVEDDRKVDDILVLSEDSTGVVGLKPTDYATEALHKYVNPDLNAIYEAIVDLLESGIVNQSLALHKIIIRKRILKISDKGVVKISEELEIDESKLGRNLYQLLKDSKKDLLEKERSISAKSKADLLSDGSAPVKSYESIVDKSEVANFFNQLTLLVKQPDNLRPIIDRDLFLWMKSWVWPDDLGKMTAEDQLLPRKSLDNFFKKWFESVKIESDKKYKRWMERSDGEQCLNVVKNDLEESIKKGANREHSEIEELERCYVSRKVLWENKNYNEHDFLKRLTKEFEAHKCLVLLGKPGLGKSTFFLRIAFQMQRQNDEKVLRRLYLIHLNILLTKLRKNLDEINNLEKALNLLEGQLSKANRDLIESAIGDDDVASNRIVLYLDALDEIHPGEPVRVTAFLKQLQSIKCVRLVISGRTHIKEIISKSFQPEPPKFTLRPLDSAEQIKLLMNYWNVRDDEKSKFDELVAVLFNYKGSNRQEQSLEISGLPLMVQMHAKIHATSFNFFLKSNEKPTPLNRPSSGKLYGKFLKKSFAIKLKKKFNLDTDLDESCVDEEFDGMFRQFVLEHQLHAAVYFGFMRKTTFRRIERKMYESFIKRINEKSEKSLLVNGYAQFSHYSFAEYVIALYLYQNMNKCTRIFQTILGHNGIRNFYLRMVEESTKISRRESHLKLMYNFFGRYKKVASWACFLDCHRLIRLLLQHPNLSSEEDLQILLTLAVRPHSFRVVNEIIRVMPYIDVQKGFSKSPLQQAILYDDVKTMETLLQNTTTLVILEDHTDRESLFNLATVACKSDVINVFLDKFGNIDIQSKHGANGFHLAAAAGRLDNVKLLMEKASHLDIQDKYGWTALHYAAQNNAVNVIEYLLENSSHCNTLTNDGESALDIANEQDDAPDAVSLLTEWSNKQTLKQ